jgi:hypothetical protein
MKPWRWVWFVLASLSFTGSTPRCLAQRAFEDQKQDIIANLPQPESLNLEDLFKKIDKQNLNAVLAGFQGLGFTPDKIRKLIDDPKLMEEAKNSLSPQVQKQLQEIPKEQLRAELEKRLASGEQRGGSQLANRQSAGTDAKTLSPATPMLGNGKSKEEIPSQSKVAQNPSPNLDQATPNPESEPADQPPPDSALSRGVMNWARSMQRLDPNLSNSPALRKVIQDLSLHLGENDPRWQKLTESASAVKERWSKLGATLHLERLLPKKGISWPQHLRRPSLPNWTQWHHDSEESPISLPTKKVLDVVGDSPKAWQGLLAGVVVGLIGVLLWGIVFRHSPRDEAEQARLELGPWPVNPAAVSSREELVKAFEYLSLLSLGSTARNWNHEIIAEHLAQQSKAAASAPLLDPDAQRHAVEELAVLYERARYAPAAEPLPEDSLLSARRDLCFLAGMPAS